MGKIFRGKGAPTTKQQDENKLQFGVKFPCAITEALISIKIAIKGKYGRINDIILKVDSGASVSLSLSRLDYLTDIKNCKLHGFPPVRPNGIGGNTKIMDLVGILNIISTGAKP
jgi:hypothetical protein